MIKGAVEETFGQETLLTYKSHQRNPHKALSPYEERRPKTSLPLHHRNGRGTAVLVKEDLERPRISISASEACDMSLLGPGESFPSPTSTAAHIRLLDKESISGEPRRTNSQTRAMKVRKSQSARFAGPRAMLLRAGDTPNKHIDDKARFSLSRLPRFSGTEHTASPESFAVPAPKIEDKQGNVPNLETLDAEDAEEVSLLIVAPNDRNHVSLTKRTADHVSSRPTATNSSRVSSPKLQASIFSTNSSPRGSVHGCPGSQSREKVTVDPRGRRPRESKDPIKAETTQSRPASSYSTTLSNTSTKRGLDANLGIVQNTQSLPVMKHADTSLDSVNAGEGQDVGIMVNDSDDHDLTMAAKGRYSGRRRERDGNKRISNRHRMNPEDAHISDQDGEVVGMQTFVIPRTASSRGEVLSSQNMNGASIQNSQQPFSLNNSFHLKDHHTRLDREPPPERSKLLTLHSGITLRSARPSIDGSLRKPKHSTQLPTVERRQGKSYQTILFHEILMYKYK